VSSDNTNLQQNDPAELLEVFDSAGNPTGRAKSRAAVHLDGDWHQAFHCWIVRPGPEIVLQRRAVSKDTFGGFWDASAAGHWRFGESPQEAARELAEELGLDVPFDRLRFRRRERMARRFANGLLDREHHQVYVLECVKPLMSYRPDPREVTAVAAIRARDLLALAAGKVHRARAVEAVSVSGSGEVAPLEVTIERYQLVPYSRARLRRLLN
jgi:isopentenyldiphosphate isomerase